MCAKFEGWANKETWAVVIWLDNDRKIYDKVQPIIQKHKPTDDKWELMIEVKDLVLKEMPHLRPGLGSELLEIALQGIDWYAIASHLLAD